MYLITDTAGTSGPTVVADAHQIADTIRPWYPDAPAEVLAAVDDLEAAILADHPRAYDLAVFLALTVEKVDRAEVDLGDPDRAQWLADMPQLAGNGHRVEVDETGIATLTGDALAVLAGLPNDVDGHYDGVNIWIGGYDHEVTEPGVGGTLRRMTAAEFRITREHLGLTLDWIAAHFDVNTRTPPRWEKGDSPVPHGVREGMEQLERHTAGVVRQLLDDCNDTRHPTLLTYRTDADYRADHPAGGFPASWHRALVGRVRAQVPCLDVDYWTPDHDTDA
jgi:hypothetical protein